MFTHTVKKWRDGYFTEERSASTVFFSMGAHLAGDDDIEDVAVETLGELYRLWQDAKRGDAACGERGWKYRFYKHKIKTETQKDGTERFVDWTTEGKIYRRGNKVFFKPIA